jgi:carboxymethylenebutenolidase
MIDMNDQHDAPERGDGISRRTFVMTTLAAGFALAVQPIAEGHIITDDKALVAGEVRIPVGGEMIPAYRAMPEGKGPFPVVLVVQEIFGVHEHIRDVCRRFARVGYMAVATELFARQGDVSTMSDMQDIMKVVAQVPDAQVLGDLDATVAWAANNGGDTGRLGITGFCWGGRIVWLYAAHNPNVKAGGAWYGRLTGATTPLQPQHPLDIASTLKTPVLGLYGGKDQGIPVDTVEQMRAALKRTGNPSEIMVYPDAGHAFFADYRPSYNEKAAKDGWRRLLEWFRKCGVA